MSGQIILTPSQMREAEQTAVRCGVSLAELMDNAGEALGRAVFSAAGKLMKKNIVILVGSGNNGGDGFVAAKYLIQSGVTPIVVLCCGQPATELSKNAAAKLNGIDLISFENAADVIASADIIVDCVFGTGFHGSIRGALSDFFALVDSSTAYKIACDVPSGVNSLNGSVSENTFRAEETVTFHMGKLGLYFSPAKEYCGKITVCDISIPYFTEEYADIEITYADERSLADKLPPRPEHSHKGTFGRLVMVCGSGHYLGAAMISARSALRSGVGIVELCTPVQVINAAAAAMPECTYTALSADEEGFVTSDNADKILQSFSRASAAVIGCGLGKTDETVKLVCEIVRRAKIPLIIDADGINCLSEHIDVLKEKQTEIILTPHAAELARLCGVSTGYILNDPLGYAKSISDKYGVVVHAKNTQTLTVSDDKCVVTDFGCSALAKGGSGDMLAGLVGSFRAQGAKAAESCVLADLVMGRSARQLRETASARGILASDIIAEFPRTLKALEAMCGE